MNVVILAAGAVQVYNAGNIPGWQYAKSVTAVVSAVGVVLVSAVASGGVDTAEWVQMSIAGLSALGVSAVPNAVPSVAAKPPY